MSKEQKDEATASVVYHDCAGCGYQFLPDEHRRCINCGDFEDDNALEAFIVKAQEALSLHEELIAALKRVEWTCEETSGHGANFCPDCGAHAKDCPCDYCTAGAEEMGEEPPDGKHADTCKLGAVLAKVGR